MGMTDGRRGSLLVITLWVMTILTVFAVAIARYLSVEIRVTKYRVAREQARALAHGGVLIAMQRLSTDAAQEPYDWLEDDWALTASEPWRIMARAGASAADDDVPWVDIAIIDEERKLALNASGVTAAMLDQVAGGAPVGQAIIDYLDAADTAEDQPALPYYPKNAAVQAVEELREIPALQDLARTDPASFIAFLNQLSPYTPGPANVNTASTEVLVALKAGTVPSGIVQSFVELRGLGAANEPGGGDDCLLTDQPSSLADLAVCLGTDAPTVQNLVETLGSQSSVLTVTAEGVVPQPPVRYRVEAVVRRTGCGAGVTGPCIVAWRE